MKIYSWNMYFRNAEHPRALRFIEHLDFDVLCLQEVPDDFLELLKRLDFELVSGNDVDRLFPARVEHNSLVILSRHPIIEHGTFALPKTKIPFRTKVFVKLMRPLGWSKIANRGGLWADIALPGFASPVRVFCLHLILAYPSARREEFDIAMKERAPELSTVVCGDLNSIESPKVSLLSWILGGKLSDTFLWERERHDVENMFAEAGLKNPLRGQVTHPFSRSQLDHVLVPLNANVVDARVLAERYGSDHSPVFAEISA
jgi:endonuclease/exonuclease/phosphatase family metal-dependent hydrolase